MSRRNRLMRRLEQRWIACFGEPPSIRTDPELMMAVLREEGFDADDFADQDNRSFRRDPAPAAALP